VREREIIMNNKLNKKVLNDYANDLRKKFGLSEFEVQRIINSTYAIHEMIQKEKQQHV